MPSQFADLIRIAGLTALLAFLWTLSVAFTYWNAHQRGLPGHKTILWVAVVALLPFAGLLLYLSSLIAARLAAKRNPPQVEERRETILKRPASQQRAMPTFVAADLGNGHAHLSQVAQIHRVLLVSSGPEQGREYRLEDLPAIIGRGPGTAISLDGDLGVSRQHAEIYPFGEGLHIRDLNSTHGTLVNGIRIEDECLQTGDVIQVGQSTLLIKTLEG